MSSTHKLSRPECLSRLLWEWQTWCLKICTMSGLRTESRSIQIKLRRLGSMRTPEILGSETCPWKDWLSTRTLGHGNWSIGYGPGTPIEPWSTRVGINFLPNPLPNYIVIFVEVYLTEKLWYMQKPTNTLLAIHTVNFFLFYPRKNLLGPIFRLFQNYSSQ